MEDRVLVLATRGRDAEVVVGLLGRQGHACKVCPDGESLALELALGAGTAVLTEESLAETDRGALGAWLAAQPAWSDFPFILLATKRSGRRPEAAVQVLRELGNVVMLERPIHGETLSSAVTSAVRGRRRQYEARRRLRQLQAAEERLTHLNETLETRIGQRTIELARANDQLMQEIAERERAQAALVQSQKMEAVGQLTGGIAHDFNNLLTIMSGNLELIARRTTDEKASVLAGYALQAADRAAKLTRQLLAFSRTQRLTLRPVDVNGLIRGMNELLPRTIGPEFTIDLRLEAGPVWAMADANQLELAILNLAINARDAMEGGGVLRISSARARGGGGDLRLGDYAVISVGDHGQGIPAHLLEKVFEPFFTTKPIGKGTGLGLSQVYGIARQSGGAVRIHSVEGEGATVEIWLPESTPPASEAASPPALARNEAPRGRVLVIEDDPGVRRFIVDCLETLGYAVVEAAQGREGLVSLDAEPPALMIVDYAMPGMNGVEVISEARGRAPGLPIIMATGYADMEAVHRVVDPEHVLRKPFRLEELESAVRHALEGPAKSG